MPSRAQQLMALTPQEIVDQLDKHEKSTRDKVTV